MFLLVVHEENATLSKCMHAIDRCLKGSKTKVRLEHRLVTNIPDETAPIDCDKVIMLLTTASGLLMTSELDWVRNLPNIGNDEKKYHVVQLANGDAKKQEEPIVNPKRLNDKPPAYQDKTETSHEETSHEDLEREKTALNEDSNEAKINVPNNTLFSKADGASSDERHRKPIAKLEPIKMECVISVQDFDKEVFVWWPKLLEFIFGRQYTYGGLGDHLKQEAFRLHTIPNYVHNVRDYYEISNPIVKTMKKMLEDLGAPFRVPVSNQTATCIIVCANTEERIPVDILAVINKKRAPVYTLALRGTTFPRELKAVSTKTFNQAQMMDFIFTVMDGLKIIDTYDRIEDFSNVAQVFLALLVFIFNIPALALQLFVAIPTFWPLIIRGLPQIAHDSRPTFINMGFTIVAVATLIVVAICEHLLYDYVMKVYSVVPLYMWMGLYLLIWQIGAHWLLVSKKGYKYGIFSLPSALLKNKYRHPKVNPGRVM